ncbi:MAG: hypothetical protein R2690_13155 [Acidimicrobiales bacterium]
MAVTLGPHQVLGVDDADDVVDVGTLGRDAAVAVEDGHLHDVGDAERRRHGHHVGPRHHDLAHHRVAELDDLLDHLGLFGLEHLAAHGLVGHGEDLLLGDERSVRQALARQDHVRQPDQRPRRQPHRRRGDQPTHRAGDGQRRPVPVQQRPGLGRRLRHDEHDDDVDERGHRHAPRPEPAVGQDAGERRLHELAHQHDEQHRVQEALRALQQGGEVGGALAAFLGQGLGPSSADVGQRRLGERQEGAGEQHHHDGDDHHQLGGRHGRAPRWLTAPATDRVRGCRAGR